MLFTRCLTRVSHILIGGRAPIKVLPSNRAWGLICILQLGPITSMAPPFPETLSVLDFSWVCPCPSRARGGRRRAEGLSAVSASAGRQREGRATQTAGLHGPGGRAGRLSSAQAGRSHKGASWEGDIPH